MGILSQFLSKVSGNTGFKVSEQLLFDKVIGFKGLSQGVGTSTIVQAVAIALSEHSNYSVCVVDTSFLSPTMYPLLVENADPERVDYLDFMGDLSVVASRTRYRNVTLFSLSKRTVVDLMSNKDNDVVVSTFIGSLKTYFDVILIDLSNELTNISTHFAIKCNHIVMVGEQSLRCFYNLRRTLNTMMTLAIPRPKANKVIINKVVPNVNADPRPPFVEAGMTVLGTIPLSYAIAASGITGSPVYDPKSTNRDILAFSALINSVIETLFVTTPLTAKYTDQEKVEESKRKWFALWGKGKKSDDSVTGDSALATVSASTPATGYDNDDDIREDL